ncbi:MAG: Uma2 family endonuclease [Lachnospiraceae bacterium]|nr:Uma2 family endonuclease [Lachnospiraceae bacterium]
MTIEEMKRIKKERGYSVMDIAEGTGLPIGTLTKIFSGQTETPRRATVRALEEFFEKDSRSYGLKNREYIGNGKALPEGSLLCETAISYGLPVKQQGEYTVDDLEDLDEWPRVELIDGVLYDMAVPRMNHARIIQALYDQVRDHIKRKGGNCEAFIAGAGVFLKDYKKNYLVPDLFISCDEEKSREDGLYGPPDFVVEVISPSSDKKDTVIKRKKYMESGVREYWIVDPKRSSVFIYLKDDPIGRIHPLSGKLGVAIYNGELQIDLDEIAAILERWP